MNELGWSIVIGLAAFRLWRLWALDSITAFLRDPVRLLLIGDPPPPGHQLAPQPGSYGWRGWAWALLSCPWCIGSWLAFAFTAIADHYVGFAAPAFVGLASAAVVGFVAART